MAGLKIYDVHFDDLFDDLFDVERVLSFSHAGFIPV
jgi:hypothetical protein